MAGIMEYIQWRGDLPFAQFPLNPVDNLIFSKLSYLQLKNAVGQKGARTLRETAQDIFADNTNNALGVLLTGEFKRMLKLMSDSRRYGSLIIRDTLEIYDEEVEIQFAVTVIELNRDTAYIAFRGTDDTLIGWKEDFKMSFMDEVPAQKIAVDYVNKAVPRFKYKKIYLGGHSKGGNLAVYAAIHAEKNVKDKIVTVYNNDGPGFRKRLLDTKEYRRVSERIVTLVPQSSVVGMLLEHEESYRVVQSTQHGLFQHDGFSWQVLGPDFVYLPRVGDDCITVDRTVKEVLLTLSDEQREAFINTFFEILDMNKNRTLTDMKKDGLKTLYSMSRNYHSLDKKTKKAISST
ncbi:MAG: hypothetical protein CSA76_04740, partial [Spirochaetales bacterium]